MIRECSSSEVEKLTLLANAKTLARLAPVEADVMAAVRCGSHQTEVDPQLDDGVFSIREVVFAPKPEKKKNK